MHISIQFLRNHEAVRAVLRKDGWHIQPEENPDGVRARHPDVQEESVARHRLNALGLLTSRICRIEFKR